MIRFWFLAARPKTLPVCICPVLFGLFYVFFRYNINWVVAFLTLLCASLIQIGTNFANDYFDFKKGADTNNRLGPKRMTQSGLISPSAMKIATYLTFFIAFIIGIILSVYGGWPIFIIGLLSIFFGIL